MNSPVACRWKACLESLGEGAEGRKGNRVSRLIECKGTGTSHNQLGFGIPTGNKGLAKEEKTHSPSSSSSSSSLSPSSALPLTPHHNTHHTGRCDQAAWSWRAPLRAEGDPGSGFQHVLLPQHQHQSMSAASRLDLPHRDAPTPPRPFHRLPPWSRPPRPSSRANRHPLRSWSNACSASGRSHASTPLSPPWRRQPWHRQQQRKARQEDGHYTEFPSR